MGREIRRVPPDWEHPRYTKDDAERSALIGKYRSLHDEDFETASEEWLQNCLLWKEGKHPDQIGKDRASYKYYWQLAGNPPDPLHYRERKWTPEEATHFQVYETVSEGTPLTPVFATKQALIDYLVSFGDFWSQHEGKGGWPKENAERFANDEFAFSMIMRPNADGPKTVTEKGYYEEEK